MNMVWMTVLSTQVWSYMISNQSNINNSYKNNNFYQLNRFLSEYFILIHKKVYKNNPKKWLDLMKQCKKHTYLRVLSCMQLMSKYARQSLVITFIFSVKIIIVLFKYFCHKLFLNLSNEISIK